MFGAYETVTWSLCKLRACTPHELTPVETVIAGGCGGAIGWAVVYPFDVVKSRMQTSQNARLLDVMTATFRTGPRIFYKGVTAAIARAFPANGALFLGYDLSMKMLRRLDGGD
jgi:hypothetical protein